MAKDKPRNTSASIRQRLLNHSTAIKTDPNLVLIWYGLERLLYRLSVSIHSERFVLKGAMLFRLWGSANFRSTKDLDLEGPHWVSTIRAFYFARFAAHGRDALGRIAGCRRRAIDQESAGAFRWQRDRDL
jgi:Nucleotidyl transferase AbiEii toxin, Type IV TA system